MANATSKNQKKTDGQKPPVFYSNALCLIIFIGADFPWRHGGIAEKRSISSFDRSSFSVRCGSAAAPS